ncbi:MAG: 50S ribosomal protein L19 [bacterium]
MQKIINDVVAGQLKKELPDLRPGDTVSVSLKVVEGNKERIQIFQGVVLRIKGGGINCTFTVQKNSDGILVERIFAIHSPNIIKIEIKRHAKVRRARLYFLRNRIGKSARLKEKR